MEILGIDVGGTGIKGAIVNIKTGELVSEKHRIPTPKGAKPDDVADEIAAMVKHFDWKGEVGCGFPSIITHGKVLSASNIHKSWKGLQADDLFSKRTGLEFHIVNDADAAGLAAMTFGAGKDKDGLVIMITIGTGLGSGMFYNGVLVPNIELGTVPYKKYKYFEHYASNSARKRDDLSYKKWGKRFNEFLKFVEFLASPDLIILGGGASKKIDKFKAQFTVNVPVVASEFENEAGIVGAAIAASRKL
ncbi:ROK family protein [Aureibaculum sp. 2210JD6-5]|uniref:polyphosphate--glucose phosphotransferase n=1 Tax=Aureibaculum sp. 2210JD6-5 TaxID=3103957 RepID=UPI002AAEBBCE|nr:ROK family protein [Aureibaculum sp. 2210JD6-5]MDY7394128.1 ROK family protein [Aureibaculum sp. 2210JD6-5]